MDKKRGLVHPYMPNSVPKIQKEMLDEIGISSVEEIYKSLIPDDLLFKGKLDVPPAILSEYELKRHVNGILEKNKTTEEYSSFLGAGCYRRQIPAICDELTMRGEFLTAYCGDTYSDHGKMQAIFEYASLMGELLDTDVVSYASYDAGQAVSSSLRMALRIKEAKGRKKAKVLMPATCNPEIFSQALSYCRHEAELVKVKATKTGGMDLEDLKKHLEKKDVAAVFVENPSYLGFFETQAKEIGELVHAHDALFIVQTEPSSLGVIESPANYGADLICGDIQALGMHQQFGGGQGGFIACQQKQELLEQFPTYMYGLAETKQKGRYGWGRAMNYRCSHGSREKANEYFGTESGLWCINAGIYLACMGPQGMFELGETIMQKLAFAEKVLSEVKGIKVNPFGSANFQEFLINFDGCHKSVAEINKALLDKKIFGGKDISSDFPEYGQSALYCISELTEEEEIYALRDALAEITRKC